MRNAAAMKKPALRPVNRCSCLDDHLYTRGREPPTSDIATMTTEYTARVSKGVMSNMR